MLSIAANTARTSASLEAFRPAFEGRIHALARAHGLLAATAGKGTDIAELVRAALVQHGEIGTRIRLSGGPFWLNTDCALAFAMMLHELVTNAEQHGALSSNTGWLEIRWSVNAAAQRLVFDWTECGGPAVPDDGQARGLGMELIERSANANLSGTANCEFARGGVHWRIDVPVSAVDGKRR